MSSFRPIDQIKQENLSANGKGLPEYVQAIKGLEGRSVELVKQDSKRSTCVSIVLSVLALLAAAAAASLIAFSGGPANLMLFIPGAVLGVTSIGLVIWLVMMVVKSLRYKRSEGAKITNLNNNIIEPKVAYEAMKKEGVSKDHIKAALSTFTPEMRQRFIAFAHNTSFKTQTEDEESYQSGAIFTDTMKGDLKVLEAIVEAFPNDVAQFSIEDGNRDFAVVILKNLSIDHPELMMKLQKKVNVPITQVEEEAYAQHPQLLAKVAQEIPQQFTPQIVLNVYKRMNDKQQIGFLRQMSNDLATFKSDHEKDTTHAKEILKAAVKPCVVATLKVELADLFPRDAEEEPSADAKELIAELAKWPKMLPEGIYGNHDLDLKGGFVDALSQAMNENQRDAFAKRGAEVIKDGVASGKLILDRLNYFGDTGIGLPVLTRRVYAKLPKALAYVDKQSLSEKAKLQRSFITYAMSSEEQAALAKEQIDQSGYFEKKFTGTLEEELKFLTLSKNKRYIKDSSAVIYFNDHPLEFKKQVLDNSSFKLEIRYALALNLLEHMEAKAANLVIAKMDKGFTMGHPRFNVLVNALVNEASKVADLSQVPQSRAILMARFMKAPQFKKFKLGPIQTNFVQLATPNLGIVSV